MKKFVATAMVFGLALVSSALAEEVKSGLESGTPVGAFIVQDCTGPAKGTSLCYRCRYGNRPTVALFTRELSPEVTALVKLIDNSVAANDDKAMAAFVVYMSSDAKAESELQALAEKQGIKSTPLTIFKGAEGPEGYKVSADAGVNVMMWVDGKVTSNHAFAPGKMSTKDVKTILGDTPSILK